MYGYQFMNMQHIAEQHGWTPFSVMENHYNLLYREDERELIPHLQADAGFIDAVQSASSRSSGAQDMAFRFPAWQDRPRGHGEI